MKINFRANLSFGHVSILTTFLFACYILSFEVTSGGYSLEFKDHGCHLRELELCVIGLTSVLQNPNGLPSKEAEFKRQCEYINESIACFEDYSNRCLVGVHLPLAKFLTQDFFGVAEEFCNSNSELRLNYTKSVSCLRDFQRKFQRSCMSDLQVGFENIHKLNTSFRLVTACCNLNRLKECIYPRIDEMCGTEAFEFVRGISTRIFGFPMEFICNNYDPFGENCTSVLPSIGTKPYNGRNTSAVSRLISSFSNP